MKIGIDCDVYPTQKSHSNTTLNSTFFRFFKWSFTSRKTKMDIATDGGTCMQMGFLRAVQEAIRMLHRAIILCLRSLSRVAHPKRVRTTLPDLGSRPLLKASENCRASRRPSQPPLVLLGGYGSGQ
ncbi:hypothetical protein BT93_C2261 [Corymbia citriodora subsp. variegata]|nr:hypothetical protein BT93_C2261 [Corymbia citriodora subsp. variegata]